MEDNIIEEDLASKSKNVFKKLSKFEEKVVQNKKQFNSEKDYKDVINRIESVKQKVQAMKNVDGTDEKVLVKHSEYLESISKELKAINKKTLKLGFLTPLLTTAAAAIFGTAFLNAKGLAINLDSLDGGGSIIAAKNLTGLKEVGKYVINNPGSTPNSFVARILTKLGIGAGLAAAGTGIATGLATKKAGNKSFANRSKEFMNEENYFNY